MNAFSLVRKTHGGRGTMLQVSYGCGPQSSCAGGMVPSVVVVAVRDDLNFRGAAPLLSSRRGVACTHDCECISTPEDTLRHYVYGSGALMVSAEEPEPAGTVGRASPCDLSMILYGHGSKPNHYFKHADPSS